MRRYITRNSVYEADLSAKTIRRVEGRHAPTSSLGPEPKTFESLLLANFGTGQVLIVQWPDGGSTMTSYVSGVEEALPEEEPEVFYCTGTTRQATYYEPAEGCENEVESEGDLCYWCDPDGAALDRAEAIAEERRYGPY